MRLQQRFLFFILFYAATLSAQIRSDSISQEQQKYFSFNYDNDFFNATDRYFTQGIRLEVALLSMRKSPLMKTLIHLQNGNYLYAIAAEQDCFTPSSIRREPILMGDRPYAAALYLSHVLISAKENKKITTQLDLGLIGPCAVCEEEQKGIHKGLNNLQPLGWEFQLRTDLLINYRLRYEKGITDLKFADLTGLAEANAGTVYDNISIGANFRLGRMPNYFTVQRTGKFQLYFFAQGRIKAVAYNATMQGGVFNRSDAYALHYAELEPVVLQYSTGFLFSFRRIALEYSKTFISREIKAGYNHGWGRISIRTNF